MERLWSPWRAKYIESAPGSGTNGCVFCEISSDADHDDENLVVYRSPECFIVLNLYPYISGHLLIVPHQHIPDLQSAAKHITDELMDLTKRSETVLQNVYRPAGFNIGINLGAAAGAGIVDHIHIHILPRWNGDTNFMSTVGGTRVLPEDLQTSYSKLKGKF
ncbi:MAG: HIT domain-containing protein [Pyrinomonadaceae bacterium]